MADAGPSMDQSSPSSSQDPPQDHGPPTKGLIRRDTSSSAGGENYKPLPPGHWLFTLHGNCPRCNHHHTAVTIKIHVRNSSSNFSHVQCENCREKWLAFAGNNSTQISLLSEATIIPDPAEKEVRLALIALIKSATPFTAVASPTLTGIPESTSSAIRGEPSTGSPYSSRLRSKPRAAGNPSRVSFHLPPSSVEGEASISFFPTPAGSPDVSELDHRGSQQPRSSLKQRVKARLLTLRRKILVTSKRSKTSPKKDGKRPVQVQLPAENPQEFVVHEGQHVDPLLGPDQTESAVANSVYRSEEAARFLDGLKNDPIERMDNGQRADWMRMKYTQFKMQRAKSTLSSTSTTADIGTQAPLHDTPYLASIRAYIPHLGSHFGLFDRPSVSDPSIRAGPLSISERASEAPTLVDDNTTVAPSIQLSRLLQRERGRSGSSRPSSLNSIGRSWQQIRQQWDQPRTSIDSNTTGGAVRSASTARDRTVHRLSRGSIGWASTFGITEMSMSQTSTPEQVDAEELANDETSPSSPPPTSSPTPQSPPQSST